MVIGIVDSGNMKNFFVLFISNLRVVLLLSLVTIFGIFAYNKYVDKTEEVTVTELLIKYKGYTVVGKDDTRQKDVYYLKLRNPYTGKDKNIRVMSGLYFNYYTGDTIGFK